MLVLFETPAGYAIFKVTDEKRLQEVDNLYVDFESPEKANKLVKLKHFSKFADMTDALSAATAAVEGKMNKELKKLLKKVFSSDIQEELAVADAKLGNVIKEKLNIACVHNAAIAELFRGIRSQMCNLITGLPKNEVDTMALGLSHSLSRYKLKFSPDKVDVMIIQAIALLDDIDKELNNYNMRCREWYGWHFPELGKLISDNLTYARVVHTLGMRGTIEEAELGEVLEEDVEEEVRAAAETSMGTEISEQDMENIRYLCQQVVEISDYRSQLYEYLKNRMMAIAPNLTMMVGELVGARLIAHAGSLLNLAKHPSSTVQILGAEKALFRALKTKHDTPKYGLIYHASLVGQAAPKNKGKISRMLAAKTSLCARVDALGEESTSSIGLDSRAKVEQRVQLCEQEKMKRLSGTGKARARAEKYEMKGTPKQYNVAGDFVFGSTPTSAMPIGSKKRGRDEANGASPVLVEGDGTEIAPVKKIKTEPDEEEEELEERPKKKKKKKKKSFGGGEDLEEVVIKTEPVDDEEVEESEEQVEVVEKPKKKKKKSHGGSGEEAIEAKKMRFEDDGVAEEEEVMEKPKKKKKKKSLV